jgi:hypothetical protein
MKQILIDFLTDYTKPNPLDNDDLFFIDEFIKLNNLSLSNVSNAKRTVCRYYENCDNGAMAECFKRDCFEPQDKAN